MQHPLKAAPLGDPTSDQLATFDRLAMTIGGFKSRERAHFRCQQTFASVEILGHSMLEIGAGTGVLSAYAATMGAKRVVALEPVEDGSTPGADMLIDRMQRDLSAPAFEVRHETIQAYEPGAQRFDIVVSYNSINHLDERACIDLKNRPAAAESYREIFRKIHSLMAPGGQLIIADCTRYNAFGSLGLRSPLMPTIQWHLHQTPATWTRLIEPVGFTRESLSQITLYPLRRFGRLCANPIADFFLASHFLMVFRRRGSVQ